MDIVSLVGERTVNRMSELISGQKLIEEYYDKIVGGYDMGCRPEDCKEAELLGESCMECVMRRTGELIASQPPADQWIPVTYHEATEEEKEVYGEFPYMLDCKLPDDGEEILVCTKSGCVWTDTFFNDDGCYLDGGYDFTELAAWMPLPEPYKEGEKE